MKKIKHVSYVYLQEQFKSTGAYLAAISDIGRRGDFTLGKKLREFEHHIETHLNVKHAIGVGNGTDALYLSLKVLGVGRGDEVITAPNSFVASAAAIALTGARPVFADVRDDYTIDPTKIEKVISKKTKAIIPVHLTGQPADMSPILQLSKKYGLWVVEDAAQAFMARYDGAFVGTLGTAGAFSFHPLKILHTWGDGGMVVTNDDNFATALRLWRNHGLQSRNEVSFFAHNSRLHTIHAAILLLLLPKIGGIIKRRQRNAQIYDALFQSLSPHVHVPKRNECLVPVSHSFTNYVVQVKNREKLTAYLARRGVETVIQYPVPIHLQPAAQPLGYKKGSFPVTELQAQTILTLPIHQYLKESDVRYVVRCIKTFYK